LRSLALTFAPATADNRVKANVAQTAKSADATQSRPIENRESKIQNPTASTPVALPYNLNVLGHRGATDNGAFNAAGMSIPAEMLPDTITSEGIVFQFAPHSNAAQTAKKNLGAPSNAVRCEGQTIELPAGNYNRIYLLAGAIGGDASGTFSITDSNGNTTSTFINVQDWTGRIGSWDNRVFEGTVPELTYSVGNPLKRIDPGYIKRDPLAWFCNQRYLKDGTYAFYTYSYLFKYALPVPAAGAKTVTLPNNPNIRVLAMTAARDPAAGTQPAQPLYDDFTGRKPIVIPEGWANSK